MTDGLPSGETKRAATIEVTVFHDGNVIERVLCESDDEAVEVAEAWVEQQNVVCQIDDLSVRHRAGDVLEPNEPELRDDPERNAMTEWRFA